MLPCSMNHKHPHLTHPKNRPDIDGLRALALIPAVIYHAFPEFMPGGFIGADIFFVISGFLISTIIFSSLERGRFSLVEFYVRRIRRIFPTLILVLFSCMTLGWFILYADEYRQLGKHTAAGAGFIQNFILWRESGYFDNDANTKPLLHLWSLAIEEQFYVFWPLLLAFVWKRHWGFLKITATITVISFAASIYLMRHSPTAAFYLPVSRFWELMIGGMLAYAGLHHPHLLNNHKNTQSVSGFLLIFVGLLILNKGRDFPGWWALFPTLGAFLVISAGPYAWLNKKLLANKLMVWVGLISYPLYLWHWTLLFYLRIVNDDPSRLEKVGTVLIAVVISWLTYMFVEKPFRFGGNPGVKSVSLIITMSLLLVIGISCFKSNGFEGLRQFDKERSEYLAYFENSIPEWKYYTKLGMFQKYRSDCDFYDRDKYRVGQGTWIPRSSIAESCFTRDPAYRHSVLIWGDSHAQQLHYGVKNNLPTDWQVLMVASSACAADPNIVNSSSTQYCEQSNWFSLRTIAEAKPDVVIVGQSNDHSLDRMNQMIVKLEQMGVKKIIFTGPTPHWKPDLPKLIARMLWNNTPQRTWIGIDQDVINLNDQLKSGFKKQTGVSFINLVDFFCNDEGCLTYIGSDKKLGITAFDYGHLTPIASNLLAQELLVKEITSQIE